MHLANRSPCWIDGIPREVAMRERRGRRHEVVEQPAELVLADERLDLR